MQANLPKKAAYKIIVVSDSHGENRIISRILKKEPDADALIHCGDVCGALEGMLLLNPGSVARPRQIPRKGTYAVLSVTEDALPHAALRTIDD